MESKHLPAYLNLSGYRQPPGTYFAYLRRVVRARQAVRARGLRLLAEGGGKFAAAGARR